MCDKTQKDNVCDEENCCAECLHGSDLCEGLEFERKNSGKIDNCFAVNVACPDCKQSLVVSETCDTLNFYTDEYREDDTGYCEKCFLTFKLPDLSTLKVVDAGLFQEMLDSLKWILTTKDQDSRIWCAIREHDGSSEWIKNLREILPKAEKA